ncbi:glutaredoxin family protein [Herbaspirillum sp. RTI4]|uniref:glutaredoxin family protein n=1 Tax=Herbaspirillum sp. RTI4 TaxID=3048640 RepID=UPI002AB3BE94|nr:glutaredoxin family protein [Herbaspirillum sp. RTI4]MDY7578497.1 glutaredoxin family protein [Herbaspirillum sp. RTI4]MEA9981474.1 glutaredoxin family protein [Herbaspirillum sp. RTI4]
MVHFTLYSRGYCHLCDEMLSALQAYAADFRFTVEVVDVDADPALVVLYDELVPVLVYSHNGAPPAQLCHYFLDREGLVDLLAKA